MKFQNLNTDMHDAGFVTGNCSAVQYLFGYLVQLFG